METILFIDSNTPIEAEVEATSPNTIKIITNSPINTSGFHLITDTGDIYEEYEDYVTLYKQCTFLQSISLRYLRISIPHRIMRKVIKPLILIGIGGLIYSLIEILYRGYTHWTMVLVGGLAFYLIGCINEHIEWDMPLYKQMMLGAVIITSLEFISGIIVNLFLQWNVWDYSNMPFNILGQICLPFTIIWFFMSFLAIILDDYLRYWIFHEEKPHYKLK